MDLTIDDKTKPEQVSNPHDAFFRRMMADKAIAKSFLQQHLPEEVKSYVDLTSLEQVPDKLIQTDLKLSICDILYRVKIGDREGYLYTLVEHQSTPETLLPLRVWQYVIKIMQRNVKNNKRVPLVLPIVIYNGKVKYNKPTRLNDLINAPSELVMNILGDFKPFQLIDLNVIKDEKLRDDTWSGVMQYVMKYAAKKNIMSNMQLLMPTLRKVVFASSDGKDNFETMIYYIMNFTQLETHEDLSKLFSKGLTTEYGDIIMAADNSLRAKLRKEAFEEGKLEGNLEGELRGERRGERRGELRGELKGKREMIVNFLKGGASIEFVANAAGLPIEEIITINESLNHSS